MKRIFLFLVAILTLGCLNGNAQSANRKGVIIDIKAGGTIGHVDEDGFREHPHNGGFNLALGVGYRIPTSMHWAFQAKLELSDNFSHGSEMITKLLSTSALVGMRWTSNDFAGNKCAYFGIGSGIEIYCGSHAGGGVAIPIEIETGINLSKRIALGVFVQPRFIAWDDGFEVEYYYYRYYHWSNVTAGVKLGLRF